MLTRFKLVDTEISRRRPWSELALVFNDSNNFSQSSAHSHISNHSLTDPVKVSVIHKYKPPSKSATFSIDYHSSNFWIPDDIIFTKNIQILMHWIAQEEYNKKETKLVFTVAVVEQLWISKSVVCSYIIVKQMPCTSLRENK